MSERSSRRDFLRGKAAADALADAGKAWEAASDRPDGEQPDEDRSSRQAAQRSRSVAARADAVRPVRSTAGSYLIQVGRRAMACQFEVFLNAGQIAAETERAIEALDLVDQLEAQLTVYRGDSEVSELNSLARRRAVRVERGLFELLRQAIQLYHQTDRAFDITSGPLIRLWAEARREGYWPDEATLRQALDRVGSDQIQLDEVAQTVRFTCPTTTINLGGIGKGYALDRCAELLQDGGVDDFMMHGGNSSILARGRRNRNRRQLADAISAPATAAPSSAKDPGLGKSRGWCIGIRHPLREDRRLLEIQLVDAAVGTSGAGTKQFYHRGKRYGHVLDPRTGLPAEGVLSATAIAPSATLADALSTAFYVLGPSRTEAFCRRHRQVHALLTTASRRAGQVDIHPINCEGLDYSVLM